jgi:hypothetical protein
MMPNAYSVEERTIADDTVWIGIRARGAEWSWLTPDEALAIGRAWLERYSRAETAAPDRAG